MIVEILYPEVCNLYGDKGNTAYLRKCLPEAQFIETSLTSEPAFVTRPVDLLYMCSMSEADQDVVIDRLMPFRNCLEALAGEGRMVFLLTGNALEVFGQYIQRPDGTRFSGLGILPSYAVQHTPVRFNSLTLATFGTTQIVGYTSRFAHSYPTSDDPGLFHVEKGIGLNPTSRAEGFHVGKLYATYTLGPLLVANPDFTKHLLAEMGADVPSLPFEEAIYAAYNKKLAEYAKAVTLD